MKVEYTEWLGETRIVDLEEFWLEWLSSGIAQAEKNWKEFKNGGDWYCYGRNTWRYLDEWENGQWQAPEEFIQSYAKSWEVQLELAKTLSYLDK
jgi:hypothetical protein